MRCDQCVANVKDRRCKLTTCKWAPYCWLHTPVEVGLSNIPGAGRGLFAKRDIPMNTKFGDYKKGKVLDKPTKGTHIALIGGVYYDASDVRRTIAGIANRAPKGKKNNCKLTKTGFTVTIRKIKAGEELYLGYGPAYRIVVPH